MRYFPRFFAGLLCCTVLLAAAPLAAQAPGNEFQAARQRIQADFQNFTGQVNAVQAATVKIQLVTVAPGSTPTTAFGHSALRILAGEEFGRRDFYVDFGAYDESLGFLWRFLRGQARFYIQVIETSGAVNAWDAAARGVVVTDLRLTTDQKARLLSALGTQLQSQGDGYEYDNFRNNCVTYIRDLLNGATGRTLAVDPDAAGDTEAHLGAPPRSWRGRVLNFSDENVWLYINEQLLFDPDTDLPRKDHELIYIPTDLLLAVRQANLAGESTILVPHRHSHHVPVFARFRAVLDEALVPRFFPTALNQFSPGGYNSKLVFSAIALLILVACLPHARLQPYRLWGERAYGVIFGFAGLYATTIRLVTFFHFMDETLSPLAFFPLDILVVRNAQRARQPEKWRTLQFRYAVFRLVVGGVGLGLATFVTPQRIAPLFFFSLAFFALYAWNRRPAARSANGVQVAAALLVLLVVTACRVDRKLDDPTVKMQKVDCTYKAYYMTNLCEDEKQYLDWAAAYRENPKLSDLTREVLHGVVQDTKDVDKAAALFYHRVLEEPDSKAFYEYLEKKEPELVKKTPDFSQHNLLLAMVPGMFYADNPDIGADGRKLRELVVKLGLKEAIIPVEQTGTVQVNAQIICDYIRDRNDVTGIIFASVSKGSSDIKYAYKLCGHEPYFKKIIGWYNIGGINRGSTLVNAMNDDWQNKWEARTYFCLQGYDWEGLMSMRADPGSPLDFDLEIPKDMLVINVIGVPTFRFVTDRARPYYEYLIRFGPNDGISLLSDIYMKGALHWVSWRNDHYFRWPISEQKMQAFVVYIIEKQMPVIQRLAAARGK